MGYSLAMMNDLAKLVYEALGPDPEKRLREAFESGEALNIGGTKVLVTSMEVTSQKGRQGDRVAPVFHFAIEA